MLSIGVLYGLFNFISIHPAAAHGTTIAPESRVYKCRFRDNPENPQNPACKEAVAIGGSQPLYDWNGINQANANGNHRAVVPDGQLCGGGNPTFRGLNAARSDWMTTDIDPGEFEFVFHGTAPHATKDWIFYITKEGWSPSSALAWDDLEPFCRHGDVPLMTDGQGRNVYKMKCTIPSRSGQHVIYNTWQRADSAEAFYTCMDTKIDGGTTVDANPEPLQSCKREASNGVACVVPAIQLLMDTP